MERKTVPDSNSKIPLAAHPVDEHSAQNTGSSTKKLIRSIFVGIMLTCVWLMVRFPYEAKSGFEDLLNGPNWVNPQTLHLRGEFVESNLGSADEPGGGVTVRMIAEQYLFVPQCVVVPTGIPIRVRMTSADVVHKPSIGETGDELKVVPGFIVETHFQFARAGVYQMPCHEFCGAGHSAMRSRLIAVPPEQFRNLSREARVNCASR
jgi:heme/copper-type cytochrome/quinol oxidase subunit 2